MNDMKYIDLIKKAKENGQWSEKTMWCAVESISEMLEDWKDQDPKAFWNFMRTQHGIMSGGHYNEEFAMHDVEQIKYTDKAGDPHEGAYWTVEQTKEATKGLTLPASVTPWDVYVALNVMHSDLCKDLDDAHIIKAAYLFFFSDEDWSKKGSSTKIWEYMSMKFNRQDDMNKLVG